MQELCRKITGDYFPPTHTHGAVPINAVFYTAGINGVAVALLPSQIGVGDHRVFMIDITSSSRLAMYFLGFFQPPADYSTVHQIRLRRATFGYLIS
jgi:hypothetical protein